MHLCIKPLIHVLDAPEFGDVVRLSHWLQALTLAENTADFTDVFDYFTLITLHHITLHSLLRESNSTAMQGPHQVLPVAAYLH